VRHRAEHIGNVATLALITLKDGLRLWIYIPRIERLDTRHDYILSGNIE
jgi:hypothetical protein